MEELWRASQEQVVAYAGRLLGAALILIIGWIAIRCLVGPLGRLVTRTRIDPSVASFLVNSARSALLVAIVLGVLQQLGVQTASLLTLLGAAGLAIALSLQSSLANFTSGLLLLSFRMVRVGDLVEMGELRGRITEMLPFHVVLVTADHQRVTVPNTLLTNGPVRNHSTLPSRRAQWTLALTAQDDLTAVKDALRGRLQADPRILRDPEPQFYITEWSQDKRNLAVMAWSTPADYPAVQQDMLEALGATLDSFRQARP